MWGDTWAVLGEYQITLGAAASLQGNLGWVAHLWTQFNHQ